MVAAGVGGAPSPGTREPLPAYGRFSPHADARGHRPAPGTDRLTVGGPFKLTRHGEPSRRVNRPGVERQRAKPTRVERFLHFDTVARLSPAYLP